MKAIDLFAGAGGFSTGARKAGVEVLLAANHWQLAIDAHGRNHPGVTHICQDLNQADFTKFPAHDLLLASPACQGHSKARGKDKPHHDACRSTAWAVISCAEVHKPRHVLVENVPEFLDWVLYPVWQLALEKLGYTIQKHILDAADFGVPQHRQRVFVFATRGKTAPKLVFPTSTHRPASSIIDLDAGRWAKITRRSHAKATLERIARGRETYGRTFVMAYYGSSRNGRSIDAPLGTVTTIDRHAIVHGDRMRMLTIDEYKRAMSFPSDYWLPKVKRPALHLLGNAVCPDVAERIVGELKRIG